ncbi:phosphomannomutase/phosphoglucomutase [Thermomonas sp. HDW16]|uniref:phosphomannomutase/phosphoglucomutase n=1 Tax=Thermomonas sp. HDW16 TaxID=2714945 RepID=UPI00140D47D7|nr:phosphomannomutase/phosphoglucomutase [Thermomonas sp. HDW16]QIL19625.1 phosphomannomutase/phosphoglucomutase [Thermomonas sp. HDW16]
MSDGDKRKLKLTRADLLRALPALAVLLVLLGGWLLYAGIQRLREDSQVVALQHARDDAATAISRLLQEDQRKLGTQLAAASVRNALAAGDLPMAAKAVAANWGGVQRSEVWPADLQGQYGALPAGGFGVLAVTEAALASGKPVARVIKSKGEQRLALAAPTTAKQGPAVVYVEMPAERLIAQVGTTSIPGSAYLALRQGASNLYERGDTELSNSAEALGTKVAGSDLRIAAAVPDPMEVPFGLPALASLVLGGLLLAGAAVLWLVVRPRLLGMERPSEDVGGTLAELQLSQPAPGVAEQAVREVVDTKAAAAPVAIDRGIFRAYDIRGVVGQTLDTGVAELIGQAIGSLMEAKGLDDIVIGRDGRLSGPELSAGLIAGLRKAGRNVIDIGMAPTPVVYFGSYHLRTGCCVAITGSHNPPEYNGFKIVVGAGTLAGPALTDLYARIAEDRLHTAKQLGGLSERDISEDYIERIAGDIQIGKRLKVVVDAGNGVAGVIGPRVLEAIGADVTPLFCDIDGTFPNHHPDPSDPRNLEALEQMVKRLDADLGIAFDGDGDRLGVITREGKNIFPDRLLMLFAADVLERNPGAMVIYDVKCTGRLPTHILRHGGSPLMWKTGHSLIKAKMRETGAELAGEMSGHFFFAERWFGFDDGIYAAARLLEILDATEHAPDLVFDALPDGVSTAEIKVDAPDGDPHAFVERFRTAASFEGARLSTIDGLRVDWPDGWGLVRASNTTPVLVMRFDADSNTAMARIQQAFREQLLAVQPDLALPF